MIYERQCQPLGTANAQRIERPRPRLFTQPATAPSALASQWLGPRLPPRRAGPRAHVSATAQARPESALALTRSGRIQQAELIGKPTSRNQELLMFLDEWMREPDDMGADWWAAFDEELEEHRLRIVERDLP